MEQRTPPQITGIKMPPTILTILGEEVKITFNLAVMLAYTQITGERFDVSDCTNMERQVSLHIASILANNPDTGITMERYLQEASAEEYTALDNAVALHLANFYHLDDAVQALLDGDSADAKTEEKEKNVSAPTTTTASS